MEYAKLQGAFLRSAAFRDADMAARGVWTTLSGYCADQENGGRIVACAAWTERQWLSRADCMRGDVDCAVVAELARWDGVDLVLVGYDAESERVFHERVMTNRQKANARWEAHRAANAAASGADAAGSATGTKDGSQRQTKAMPPAMPQHPDGMPPASISDATDRPTDIPKDLRSGGRGSAPPKGAQTAVAAAASASTAAEALAPEAAPRTTTTTAGGDDNAKLRVRLGRYGMAASPQATAEWAGLLRERAGITLWDDVGTFLGECAKRGRATGKPIRYARDAIAMADEWRDGARPDGASA